MLLTDQTICYSNHRDKFYEYGGRKGGGGGGWGRKRSSVPLVAKEPPFTGDAILRITPPVNGGSLAAKGAELHSLPHPPPLLSSMSSFSRQQINTVTMNSLYLHPLTSIISAFRVKRSPRSHLRFVKWSCLETTSKCRRSWSFGNLCLLNQTTLST